MKRRIAFVDYFCPHYRRPLFEEIARRTEADFYFFSDHRDRWWNSRIPVERGGDFRRIELPRMRIGPEAFLPTLPLHITPAHYDAVIKNLNGRVMLPLLYATCKLRGVPFVLWTGMWQHPSTRFHRLSKPVVEALYRDVGAIVAYGDHVKAFLTAVPGVDPAKIFVAGQAVEPDRFAAVQPDSHGRPVALFIGQFEERKGVRDLLDAFAGLTNLGAELRLVGNGTLEGEIRSRAASIPGVSIAGYVPQDRLPGELARARCLVLPSITIPGGKEPWGLVVNEAMHAGLPVVATESLGAAAGGLVRDGRNGYVVPERDPDRLAGALRRLLSDAEIASQLGRQARDDVADFNYDRMAGAFEAAVEHAIAAHHGSARTG
jgi:glycosyltransferase involved in cell wall biosynthesis